MAFPQWVQSAFLERIVEATDHGDGMIRLLAWPVINKQLVYLLDLQPISQATTLPVEATASVEGQPLIDPMRMLKGITDTIEDFRILPQSTLQLIRIVGILEHLTRCHDDTQTDDNMRELADLIKCLSHFPELLKEDVAAVMDVIVSVVGSQQILKRSIRTFTQKLTQFVLFVVEQRLGEPECFREYRASLQPRQTSQQLSDKQTELGQDKDEKPRTKLMWDDEEVATLERGIAEFGVGNWKDIIDNYEFQPGRTNVDLKDKYRNMKGRNRKRRQID